VFVSESAESCSFLVVLKGKLPVPLQGIESTHSLFRFSCYGWVGPIAVLYVAEKRKIIVGCEVSTLVNIWIVTFCVMIP
jgi:hypothetical protein